MKAMGALPAVKMSVAEYFIAEEKAHRPSEYHDGELYPIVDASVNHAMIAANFTGSAHAALKGSPCRALAMPRVRASARSFVLPDIAIVCGPVNFAPENQDSIVNPKVIVEVLSPSTADYDYGGKFELYREIPSLQEYVLVSQKRTSVDVFRKPSEENFTLFTYRGLDASLDLETLNISIPLGEIYAGIEFPTPDA